MARVETAEASMPQILHPIEGDAPVETGQVDAQALWVVLTDTWPDIGPEPRMRHAFHYMLSFTASDLDFRLYSMEECFPVVELLVQSLDI